MWNDYGLIIFDLDGTLARPASGATFRAPGEKYVWLPKRCEMLRQVYTQDCAIAVATNQGGIAAGHLEYRETETAIYDLLRDLPFHVPFLLCPYVGSYQGAFNEEWRSYAPWRKPSGLMLTMLIAQYPQLFLRQVLMVGDRREDEFAASNAGIDYEPIEAFMRPWLRERPEEEDTPF